MIMMYDGNGDIQQCSEDSNVDDVIIINFTLMKCDNNENENTYCRKHDTYNQNQSENNKLSTNNKFKKLV